MINHLEDYLKAQQEPLKSALIELVRIPSICEEGGGGYPFGEAVDLALNTALQIADGLGFRTRYGDGGYYGIAEVGKGKEILAILGHLDVVPPGNRQDWNRDPFDPFESDGMLYGRGTQDDKGPMIAAMFAVKALMAAGVMFNKRVRLIFGTDEETLWRCIKKYLEKEEKPDMGFSPDARFPVTYAEKGLLQLHLEGINQSGVRLIGGSAFNAVPDMVFFNGNLQDAVADKLTQLGFAHERRDDGIEVRGEAAHAMNPEEGINAIARLCIALKAVGIQSKCINFIAEEIGENPYATRIFGECADEPSGKLKFTVGKIELGEVEKLSIDVRIPVTVSKEEIVAKLIAAAEDYGLKYKEFDWLAPIYLPLDHFIVKTLMNVYRRQSGDMVTQPKSSGGATYARAIQNCVAFGALTCDEPMTEHQPNERAVLKNLYDAMGIYAHAVYELACSPDSAK